VLIKYFHDREYVFLAKDDKSFLTGVALEKNIIDLVYRRVRQCVSVFNENGEQEVQHSTFDPQRQRSTPRRELTTEPPIDNILSLTKRKRIIHRVLSVALLGKTPRMLQIEGVYRLLHENKNTLLVRKTGEGKSDVFNGCCCLAGGVVLCITPLLGRSAQQRQQMKFLGCHGVHALHLDVLGDVAEEHI